MEQGEGEGMRIAGSEKGTNCFEHGKHIPSLLSFKDTTIVCSTQLVLASYWKCDGFNCHWELFWEPLHTPSIDRPPRNVDTMVESRCIRILCCEEGKCVRLKGFRSDAMIHDEQYNAYGCRCLWRFPAPYYSPPTNRSFLSRWHYIPIEETVASELMTLWSTLAWLPL